MGQDRKIIVVKIGSSTLIDGDGRLDRAYLNQLADQLAALRAQGWSPVIVSSGAIACGFRTLGFSERPTDMPTLQASASVGQLELMGGYADALARHDITTSVVLITRTTTKHRESYLHARDTILRLVDLGVIPVINENDTVSVEQIRFGDNDTLSALVACLVSARMCVIFSDIDGLYTANPSQDCDARLIPVVERITPHILSIAGGSGSSVGSGGMITKIRAARVLMVAGIEMVICEGHASRPLERIVAGEAVGTRFASASVPHEITPKKLWIALGDSAKGSLIVDPGAKQALIERGSSLLAVGLRGVEGSFGAGDIVDIVDEAGHLFARGKVGASSSEVVLACGRSQQEIKSNELLRNLAQRPVVHRDELVVFE